PPTGPGAPAAGPSPGPTPPATPGAQSGYWMLGRDGRVYPFGDAAGHGQAATGDAVDLEPTPSGGGYWVVDSAGRVFALGDAVDFGAVQPSQLTSGEVVTSLSASPSGRG
ncbi:MAG: hypothetical protein ACRDY7_10305, partial [Acidimicrobiia bacterium]